MRASNGLKSYDPAILKATQDPRVLARFWAKVRKSRNCWTWTAFVHPIGYGRFGIPDIIQAHRFAYIAANGELADSTLTIDHICRNRACVRPSHLEAVTHETNCSRGAYATKTHCIRGHPFSGYNLILLKRGWRRCRACQNWHQRRAYRQKLDW